MEASLLWFCCLIQDAIDKAITGALDMPPAEYVAGYETGEFTPFNPVDKYTQCTCKNPEGKTIYARKGAPAVMANLHGLSQEVRNRASDIILAKAKHGLRGVGVAVSEDATTWRLLGMTSLFPIVVMISTM